MTLSRPAMPAVVAALGLLQATPAAAYCVYNKSSHFDVLVSLRGAAGTPEAGRVLPEWRVRPGDSQCCSASDKTCLPAANSTHIDVLVSTATGPQRAPLACGVPGAAIPFRLPVSGYLLLRQSRADAGRAAGTDNATLAIDAMEIDGRLIRTLPCAVSADRPTGGGR